MAKKRRKPQNRSRNRPTGAATRTADRPPSAPKDVTQDGRSDLSGDGAHRAEGPATAAPGPGLASPGARSSAHQGREEGARARRTRGGTTSDRPRPAPAPARVDRRHRDRRSRPACSSSPNRNDTSSTPPGGLPGELTTEAPWPANGGEVGRARNRPWSAARGHHAARARPPAGLHPRQGGAGPERTSASSDAGSHPVPPHARRHRRGAHRVIGITRVHAGRVLRRLGRALHPELPGCVLQRAGPTASRCS